MEAIALLTERSKKETRDATQALSGQLLELQDATKTAAAEIEDMTTSVSGRIEAVLERAGEAVNASRKRSEEHTSELQSLMRTSYAVFGLKKPQDTNTHTEHRKSTVLNSST